MSSPTAPPPSLARALCHNHPAREAAARCVECKRPFCRECVTPLDRRMFCAECYRAKTEKKVRKKRDWFLVSASVQTFFGLLLLWATFYFIGKLLLDIPSSFHEGAVWEKIAP